MSLLHATCLNQDRCDAILKMSETRKEKLKRQEDEQYHSVGRFVVQFEHLFFAIKNKMKILCGNYEEVSLLLEPFSVRQTIDVLSNLINYKTKNWEKENNDKILFKKLIKDLNTLNQKRNALIHTTWFIGWQSEETTDISEFDGYKFSSQHNFKTKKLTANEINEMTKLSQDLYNVFFTVWPIDIYSKNNLPEFSKIWSRDENGNWSRT